MERISDDIKEPVRAREPGSKNRTLGKLREFNVDLASLRDGHYEEDYRIGRQFFEDMENCDVLGADVEVHLDIEVRHESYDCRFHFAGRMEVPCDRCLDPVEVPVDTDYHVVVRYGEEYDDSQEDLLVLPWQETSLNVAGIIYDTLLLAIPLRCVHPEGECNSEMSGYLRAHGADDDTDTDGDETEADIE